MTDKEALQLAIKDVQESEEAAGRLVYDREKGRIVAAPGPRPKADPLPVTLEDLKVS